MNLKNVALGLMLVGSVFAVGCGGDDDTGPAPLPDVERVTCDTQGEAGSRVFPIRRLTIPTAPPEGEIPPVGFNVDGLTSTATDLAGCNKADLSGGVDNGLAAIINGLGPVLSRTGVDINEELQTAVEGDAIDLEVEIGDWNMTATDPCVTITIQGMTAGSAITPITSNAPLNGGFVTLVTFSSNLTITPSFQVGPDGGLGSCTANCTPVDLAITIQDLRARLRLSPDLNDLIVAGSPDNMNSSMVGGYVKYTGTDPSAFQTSLNTLIGAIDPNVSDVVGGIFTQFLDLDTDPALAACTSVGSGTSADTFSAAILAGSVAPN